MAFKIPLDIQAKHVERMDYHNRKVQEIQTLSDGALGKAAYDCMQNMPDAVWRCRPGEPVYDATFFHVLMPEIIKRLTRDPLGPPPSNGTPCT